MRRKSLLLSLPLLISGIFVAKRTTKKLIPNSIKANMLNRLSPKDFVKQECAYGDSPRQTLNIYRSSEQSHTSLNQTKPSSPVIFFVHGGSWNSGNKDDYDFLAESFTREGFVVVIINYHLAPEHVYPSFVDDTALAIKWTFDHINDFGGDNNNIFALGHSAGAFNIVSAVNNDKYYQKYAITKDAVKAVVAIAGPYNYDFSIDETAYAFPSDLNQSEVMPVNFIKENPIPHLLLTAEKDTLVADSNTDDLKKALAEKNGHAVVKKIKNTNHITIIASLATRLHFMSDTSAEIIKFIDAQYKTEVVSCFNSL